MIQKTQYPMLSFLTEKCTSLHQLKQIHSYLLKSELLHYPATFARLLSFAAVSENPSFFPYACSIFRSVPFRSTFLFNTILRGYVQRNLPISAILCYKKMMKDRIIVNNYTFTPLVKACSLVINMFDKKGCSIHSHVLKLGFLQDLFIVTSLIELYSSIFEMGKARVLYDEIFHKDVVLWTAMIDGYGKAGKVEMAREMFEEMPERNIISWSAIVAAYSRANNFKEVICLYRAMEESSIKPNESILVSVITACAHLGALAQGMWIHKYAKKHGFLFNTILSTALVDMYSKCGCMELASSVFEGMSNKDSGSWNSIISGFAMNGYASKSLEMLDAMVLSGTQTTAATFVAALSACTHANMIDKGYLLFQEMTSVYCIEPQVEHFACMVDLLARAGRLDEAYKFIEETMGGISQGDVEVNVNVWGALLHACRVYKNPKMGDRIWRKLASMSVSNFGIHLLSYNMYIESGWEKEASHVRKLIDDTRMKKKPGCSVIEVNGLLEEFLATCHVKHPKAREIYQMINSLFTVMCIIQ